MQLPARHRDGRRSRRRRAHRSQATGRGQWLLAFALAVVAAVAVATVVGGVAAGASNTPTPALPAASATGLHPLLDPMRLPTLPAVRRISEKPGTAPDSAAYTFALKGTERYYRLHLPDDTAPARATPLLVVLPGWRRTARDAEDEYGFDQLANAQGFAVAYLDGVHSSWNAGTCCGYAAEQQLSDVSAVHTVVDEIAGQMRVDRHHVVLAGFSNGGMLAYRMGCQQSSQLAGIIVDSASLEYSPCNPGPLSIVSGHGARDTTLPYKGSKYSSYLKGPVSSQAASLAPFLKADRCTSTRSLTSGRYAVVRLRGCTYGTTIDTYLDGLGGHAWPGTVPGGHSFSATALALLDHRPSVVPFAP